MQLFRIGGLDGWLVSFEYKDEIQLWRTSEESGLVAVRDVGFIVTADVGDVARNGKVAHREVSTSSWFALYPDENSIVRITPSTCRLRAARFEAHSVFSCGCAASSRLTRR